MKQDWKPDELRATAEEIRKAVMPKSITPEMVGGTLVGLVDGTAEIVGALGGIPSEHVRVTVKATNGQVVVPTAGAKVMLDIFNVPGFPATVIPRQELICGEGGVVEFDVPHGFCYAVFSQVEGLGASFQFVYHAAADTRNITLYNLPVGILFCRLFAHVNDNTGLWQYRPVPYHEVSYDNYTGANPELWLEDGEYLDEMIYVESVVVSTADTSFAIELQNLAPEKLQWSSGQLCCDGIPTLPQYGFNGSLMGDAYNNEWSAAKDKAHRDMDGNMNTAKILAADSGNSAAVWCQGHCGEYHSIGFLPSCGQLRIMWENRIAINAMMAAISEVVSCTEFQLLPYTNDKGQWQYPNGELEEWWSSTAATDRQSWWFDCKGFSTINDRRYAMNVRVLSAIQFEY